MNTELIIILVIIIFLLILKSNKNKENFWVLNRNYEPDLLYTYESIFYPEYIKKYADKNYNFLELSEPESKTGTKYCQDCSSLDKTECGLCYECGWCIDKKGNGKCVPGGMRGQHSCKDRETCNIYRHPSLFKRFSGPFTGRKFIKEEYDDYWKPNSL